MLAAIKQTGGGIDAVTSTELTSRPCYLWSRFSHGANRHCSASALAAAVDTIGTTNLIRSYLTRAGERTGLRQDRLSET